jgi:hypothetical protein
MGENNGLMVIYLKRPISIYAKSRETNGRVQQ